jgi:predicted nucleotidyltransferase
MLTEKEIAAFVQRIVDCMKPEQVIIFGSYGKGKATRRSDLDIFILKDVHVPKPYRANPMRHLMDSLLVAMDVHVYNFEEVDVYMKEKGSFVHSIMKTGKVYYTHPHSQRVRDLQGITAGVI